MTSTDRYSSIIEKEEDEFHANLTDIMISNFKLDHFINNYRFMVLGISH